MEGAHLCRVEERHAEGLAARLAKRLAEPPERLA